MIPTWFALVCLAGVWWARSREHGIVVVVLLSTAFGATAAAEVVLLGGAPLTPLMFVLPFLFWHVVRIVGWRALVAQCSLWRPGGWLLLFFLWSAFTAVVMPRVFAGDTMVFTTNRQEGLGVLLVPLQPNSTNITQSVYLGTSVLVFVAVAALVRARVSASGVVFTGLFAVGALNIAGAILQLAEAYGGVNLGLSLLRNANYAITEGQMVGRLVRIHGFFVETSSFSGFSVPLFAAFMVCWVRGYRTRVAAPLALVTLVLLCLTTSTTAYVSLALVVSILAAGWSLGRLVNEGETRFGSASLVLLLGVSGLCLVLLLKPALADQAARLVQEMVFNKLDSDSGRERSDWTARAWANFIDTYGLGAGAGSSRGSSWPVVVMGNVGLPGAALMTGFLMMVMWPLPSGASEELRTQALAAQAALAGVLACAVVSGTMIDLGPAAYLYPALAAGLRFRARDQSTANPSLTRPRAALA